MARITVEDCIKKISDRFKLVTLATQRAKDINSGSKITVINNQKDKSTVLALREIALGHINIENLKNKLLSRLRIKNKITINSIDKDETYSNNIENNTNDFDYISNEENLYINNIHYSDLDNSLLNDQFTEDTQNHNL